MIISVSVSMSTTRNESMSLVVSSMKCVKI